MRHNGAFDRIYAQWIGPIEPHPIRLAQDLMRRFGPEPHQLDIGQPPGEPHRGGGIDQTVFVGNAPPVGTVDINSGVEATNGVISIESPGLLTVGQNVAPGAH